MNDAVCFEQTPTSYRAYAPDLPGCIAAASTLAETSHLMLEAMEMRLELMRESGEPIPEPTTVADSIAV